MTTRLVLFATMAFALAPLSATALNVSKCSAMLNDGLYKKYQYHGIDQPLTKATKKHGTFKGTGVVSTEGSTATLDPSYTLHMAMFNMQTISSWGACSSFGYNRLQRQRELYIAQNRDEILRDLAVGQGEHLAVLAAYSLCDDQAIGRFSETLQSHTEDFVTPQKSYGEVIDKAVDQDQNLKTSCHSFGA